MVPSDLGDKGPIYGMGSFFSSGLVLHRREAVALAFSPVVPGTLSLIYRGGLPWDLDPPRVFKSKCTLDPSLTDDSLTFQALTEAATATAFEDRPPSSSRPRQESRRGDSLPGAGEGLHVRSAQLLSRGSEAACCLAWQKQNARWGPLPSSAGAALAVFLLA